MTSTDLNVIRGGTRMDVPGISNLAILRHNRGIKIPAFCVPDLPISNFFDDIFFSFLNSALILFPLSHSFFTFEIL